MLLIIRVPKVIFVPAVVEVVPRLFGVLVHESSFAIEIFICALMLALFKVSFASTLKK